MPFGTGSKTADKKIEACVNTLMASPDFKPNLKKFGNKSKKVAAIRICKSQILKKTKKRK